jgi:2-keto-3-deoxy-L-rhamnonate aldolase RhmA
MTSKVFLAALGAALLASTCAAFAQDMSQNDSNASAQSKWPLAAKAGVDSHALTTPLPGEINKGAYSDKTWIRGHRQDAPAGAQLWNPVKVKMMQGGKITSVTVPADSNANVYCEAANSGVDYIWTEVQHGVGGWANIYDEWNGCPHAKAVPGARVPNANEMDEQHAMDNGALVLVIPTVRSVEEAKEAVKWAYFPPMGGRSQGGSSLAFWGGVPGGYRNTINDNLVLILMIETMDGLKDADKIAKLPGVTGLFAASGDLGNFGGYKQGDPDYEREINIVHDATVKAHIALWGPYAWNGRPDFVGFQGPGGSEAGDLVGPNARLAANFLEQEKKDLGPLYMTQGKPKVGPYAPGWVQPTKPVTYVGPAGSGNL